MAKGARFTRKTATSGEKCFIYIFLSKKDVLLGTPDDNTPWQRVVERYSLPGVENISVITNLHEQGRLLSSRLKIYGLSASADQRLLTFHNVRLFVGCLFCNLVSVSPTFTP